MTRQARRHWAIGLQDPRRIYNELMEKTQEVHTSRGKNPRLRVILKAGALLARVRSVNWNVAALAALMWLWSISGDVCYQTGKPL